MAKFRGLRYYCPSIALSILFTFMFGGVVALFYTGFRNRFIRPTILLPLYIAPGHNATNWLPLYKAIHAWPHLHFVIVLNPNNGPNTTISPDPEYRYALNTLRHLIEDNQSRGGKGKIRVLGYVHQSYGNRSYEDVTRDITTWSTWSHPTMYNYTLQGIFFDESPYSPDPSSINYIDTVTAIARSTSFNTTIQQPVFTVQNPGVTPPENQFLDRGRGDVVETNVTIVLEDTFQKFQIDEKSKYSVLAAKYGTTPDHFAMVLSSVPNGWSGDQWKRTIQTTALDARYLFMTDEKNGNGTYSKFGDGWDKFVEAMAVT